VSEVTTRPAVLFGAAYYHEYQLEPRLDIDVDLMAEAGFSVIRVGESVWSTWEPAEGQFNLDWLAPIIDAAHARGIGVVVGTPTYAVPPWLRQRYPETTAQRRSGVPIPYGHRQDVDFTHPAFRHRAAQVVTRIVKRYADHPAVIGWQIDNEPGIELLHNPAVFVGFIDHLKATYADVDALNDAWGLAYWSHRINDWSQLWTPDGNTVPAYDLAWRRYQADLTSEFIAWQADLVRGLARPDQFVTTCLALGRPALDPVALARSLDVTSVNAYFPMQDALTMPRPSRPAVGGRPEWLPDTGVWGLYLQADSAYGVRSEPFLVTETNAASIGEAHVNYPAYDGQWRQAAWALVARGARMVEYWHWHTAHNGHETYWAGILGHSLRPGRCYAELARIGAELAAADQHIAGLVPHADVAILTDPDSRWAMQFHSPLPIPDAQTADPSAYDRILGSFYRGMFDAGLSAAIVDPRQLGSDPVALARRWPVLVAPAYLIAGDEVLALLRDYAYAGGHLVAGLRTGYADRLARPRPALMPAFLTDVAGVHYTEYSNLATPLPVVGAGGFDVAGGHAVGWADGLQVTDATVLARYEHQHFGQWPAITTRAVAAGRVTYVGTLPDADLGAALGRWIRSTSLPPEPWPGRPPTVTVTAARNGRDEHLWFISNWSFQPAQISVPVAVQDLVGGAHHAAGDHLTLGPWDVQIVRTQPASMPQQSLGDHRGAGRSATTSLRAPTS
jgi:beta-galactosidase